MREVFQSRLKMFLQDVFQERLQDVLEDEKLLRLKRLQDECLQGFIIMQFLPTRKVNEILEKNLQVPETFFSIEAIG